MRISDWRSDWCASALPALRLAIVPGGRSPTDHKRNFMRKTLLASTCLAAMAAMPLHAETTIDSATTATVGTSTVKAGAPDDIQITKDGSIKPTGGTAGTIDRATKASGQATCREREGQNVRIKVAAESY